MNPHVVLSIFRRNFAGYFSSPIGYVFICAFVLLSGFAAFWPNDFFNANLATLDQLNERLPWIMLVFIPAITMGIWADERRQATDELVLTLPCTDLDVVIGKYLAALAIFTVALVFSLSNILVLRGLGRPDIGLLFGNYVGYWLVGAAMLSIGMVASFLTGSLTVAFILALAFNAPLIFAYWADSIISWDSGAHFVKSTSIAAQYADFGKGLLTLSGAVFFGSIAVIGLYLSMVLIGRRHWAGGPGSAATSLHFVVRALALIAIVVGINVLINRYDARADVTAEKVNSLSPQTIAMLKNLDTPRPVYVEAYISPQVPEEFVQTQLNLLSMLHEVGKMGGDKVVVRTHMTPRFSEAEAEAAQQFGIQARPVQSSAGGKMAVDQIVLGAAFTCGLEKVVVPFFDRGIPVEYEIVRSIATVSLQKRKKIGVLMTDAKMFGGFDVDTMSSRGDQEIIDELKKQYDVVQVNATNPITERYDALLAVQPSSLTGPQMSNFLAAVSSGQPTAIFEDPFPASDPTIPATSQPRMPPRRNPFMQQQPPAPKGDVGQLWATLGVRFHEKDIIWQDYNPYPKIGDFSKIKEYVFIGKQSTAAEPFNQSNPITSGLQQMVALFPGAIEPLGNGRTTVTPLVQTGKRTGVVAFDEIVTRNFLGGGQLNPNRRQRQTGETYTLAALITSNGNPGNAPGSAPGDAPASGGINVVLVSDVDVLNSVFFTLRARGTDKSDPVQFTLDNVAFVLNTLDYLAGDHRFIELRKRRPAYRTLTTVENQTEKAKKDANDERDKFVSLFEDKRAEEQKKLDDKLAEIKKREGVDAMQMAQEVGFATQAGQTRLNTAVDRLEKERDQQLEKIDRDLTLKVMQVQNRYKLMAIALPPIPPLILGAIVFFRRRSMERIGAPKARLRH